MTLSNLIIALAPIGFAYMFYLIGYYNGKEWRKADIENKRHTEELIQYKLSDIRAILSIIQKESSSGILPQVVAYIKSLNNEVSKTRKT